jgi:ATP-binding cassette subfamily B protein
MVFLRTYLRALGTLRQHSWIAAMLVLANLVVAGLQFVDPLLFGRVIELLTRSSTMTTDQLWQEAAE